MVLQRTKLLDRAVSSLFVDVDIDLSEARARDAGPSLRSAVAMHEGDGATRAMLLQRLTMACQRWMPVGWSPRTHALTDPLTIVVGYAAGGTTDRLARLMAARLGAKLGVAVSVVNRPGDGGRLAAQKFKRIAADRNVVMLSNSAVMVVAPNLYKSVGYEPADDFVPLSQVCSYDYAVAVETAMPPDRLVSLVTWLWANPRRSQFSVPATGSLPHFFALMLGDVLAIQHQITDYKGSAPLQADMKTGKAQIAIDTFDSLYPQHVAGRVRILATSGTERARSAPEVPTFREAGLDIDASGWDAFFASQSMPAGKIKLIAAAIRAVMQDPALQKAFHDMHVRPVVSTIDETAAMIETFRQKWAPRLRTSGLRCGAVDAFLQQAAIHHTLPGARSAA